MHARLELHRIAWLPAAAILLAFVGGCAQRSRGPDTVTDCGRIYMFPGIEGNRWSLSWACAGLRDAGVNSAIRVVDWDRPLGGLANLTDYEGNRRLARRVASDIAEYRATYRTAPIDLLGYSGGGGLAVLVAEELPEGICVRNVVLAQPALSPEYDLTLALRRIDGKLVNFYSPHDWLILGLGTRFFGTIDRAKTMSAGKERINLSRAVHDERLHTEVEQVGWNAQMLATGHLGGHVGILSYGWNRRWVAPYLLADAPASVQRRQSGAMPVSCCGAAR